MKTESAVKTGLSALSAVIAFYMDKVTALIWLLIGFELADYITGIVSACKNKGLSSKEAFWGFIKKLLYFILVGVAFGIDYFISDVIDTVGLDFNCPAIFGILAVCYLLSTEGISILENLGEMGIEVPFLSKFIQKIRSKISEKGEEYDG